MAVVKYWYPRTCSEDWGCILELTNSTTLGGLSKTCSGHAGATVFARTVVPPASGIVHGAVNAADATAFNSILSQNQAGTEQSPIIPIPFKVWDEMRSGDKTAFGMADILVVYEADMVRPGDSNTAPPNAAFLNTFFSGLKTANPTIERVCLDYEAWTLITGTGPTGVNATIVGYYVTLVNAAKAYFSNVGLYGEICERYTQYLNFPVGHATYIQRKADWQARQVLMQAMFDAVDTLYPSFYYINPTHNNADLRDAWYADSIAVCNTRAPGKPVIAFVWPRIHNSVDPLMPEVSGAYWRSTIDTFFTLCNGIAIWRFSADDDPEARVPIPDWWTEQKDFNSDHSITVGT